MNGVLVFRLSICAGEREQMFLVSPSCFLCPLPSPNSAAGSINVLTLRLNPTQCLSQHRPWWEECQKLRGSPCSSLLPGWLWLPIGFRKQPWPQIQTWWRFHAVSPLWFCLLHCLLLCSLLRLAPHYPAILGYYPFSFPGLDGSWLQMATALSLPAVPAPLMRHALDCQFFSVTKTVAPLASGYQLHIPIQPLGLGQLPLLHMWLLLRCLRTDQLHWHSFIMPYI